jgi:hypothetical protein
MNGHHNLSPHPVLFGFVKRISQILYLFKLEYVYYRSIQWDKTEMISCRDTLAHDLLLYSSIHYLNHKTHYSRSLQTRSPMVEPTSSASMVPVSVLIDELKSENVKRRVNSMKSLAIIANALGKDRSRTELLPFLNGHHSYSPPLIS